MVKNDTITYLVLLGLSLLDPPELLLLPLDPLCLSTPEPRQIHAVKKKPGPSLARVVSHCWATGP